MAQGAANIPKDAAMDPIADYLQPLVQNHTLAGAVVLVANKDGILYDKGAGFRDIAAQPTHGLR